MIEEISKNEYLKNDNLTDYLNLTTKKWIQLISQSYKYPVRIFGVNEGNTISTSLLFFITKNWKGDEKLIFIPFLDDISLKDIKTNFLNELLLFIKNNFLTEYSQIVFHTDLESIISDNPEMKNFLFFDKSYIKHTIDLANDIELIKNNCSKNCKRNINKAKKNQILIKRSVDEKTLRNFYDLHLLTRKKHGTPIQPYGFFKMLKELILDKGSGFILTAYKDDIPLASAIFLYDDYSMIYKYGASDPKLLHNRPNEILFLEAIKIAKEKNLKLFDFGISKVSNSGLRHFKSGFGATEIPVSYSIISDKPINSKGKTGDNKVVKFIIRHSPLWVNRLIGELFYRYAA